MSLEIIFWTLTAAAFAFGAVVGSFLNVVIHRVPAGESIVRPASRCPECGSAIRWYDNIPIISWALLLRGRCRDCGEPISARYALVEALTAVLATGVWLKVTGGVFESREAFYQTPVVDYALPFLLYFAFVALLVVITFVDLEHLIIPHQFTLPGIALGVAAPLLFDTFVSPGSLADVWPPVTLVESVIGLVAGGLAVVIIFYGYFAIRGMAGIGGGDVTLMALVGAWLGWPALVFVFFAASLQGTLAAVAAMFLGSGFLRDSAEIFHDEESDSDPHEPLDADAVVSVEPDESSTPNADEVDETSEVHPDPDRDEEEAEDEAPRRGAMAVPFGPFIALAALEHFFFGELLPPMISMSYLYTHGTW